MRKYLIFILIISLLFPVTVFSLSPTEKINAVVNRNLKILWNGEPFTPSDKGVPLYPIVYNGYSYLPVRPIAEKAGITIGWDATIETIRLDQDDTLQLYREKELYNDIASFAKDLTDFTYRVQLVDYSLAQKEQKDQKHLASAQEFIKNAKSKSDRLKSQKNALVIVYGIDVKLLDEFLVLLSESIQAYSDAIDGLVQHHQASSPYSMFIHHHTNATKLAYDVWSVSSEKRDTLSEELKSVLQ
ncbi:hypothetical protein BHU72_07405 [Desulfuribacillus stibiiarsenatis]|uniref:Copper amine oxidase-like N-terminal domain-containing protein n=1 Tax=Desulfuribacillus stibiiarsenatis TaxID=1390249 RepID=A0A1E5L4I8_9FIRM|nr:stalk domain-containing protein [Desulfuribacillus stibiiarsenatis]OEH85006.1 hypothetical protein BHU72_07405 [Desulfuribacillus stibiiarsenatis]